MRINYCNAQLIILLILDILLEVVLYIALITLRFNIISLSFIEIE